MKVNILKLSSSDYPEVLRQIPNPPEEIHWAGANLGVWFDRPRVAIVGSRKASQYGRAVTQKLATELARAGVVIISGLAIGIDSIAHKATLDAGGLTVAVLPTPLEHI